MYEELAKALRILSAEMVTKAKSGHTGLPLGMADVLTVLYHDFLQFNPSDPKWANRDRLIFSAGHGSALLYSLLYLTGYSDISIDDLRYFRQLGSKTAGHPEYGLLSGIETTTGPLGQGIANGVGMAIAQKLHAARGKDLAHKIYVVCGDGCLMEGVSYEAISLAGHLSLDNLIILFDDNSITIDGATDLTVSEDHKKKFEAMGWKVISVDGHDYDAINATISWSKHQDTPVMIACKTIIGKYCGIKEGTAGIHGTPLSEEELDKMKQSLGWSYNKFVIPDSILAKWRGLYKRCLKLYDNNIKNLDNSSLLLLDDHLWDNFKYKMLSNKQSATRQSSQKTLNFLSEHLNNMIGGSADLTPSNNTVIKDDDAISRYNFKGSYIHYGVREHAMAAIMNGISLYGGFLPYGGTFLVFSDYMRPALRLSAIMKLQILYIMTHDSIGLGEDGATHQPVEHLASLRAMPGLYVFRPCDAIEVVESYQSALKISNAPSILALTRQSVPISRKDVSENLTYYGAYVIRFADNADIIIYASGSEVSLAIEVAATLEEKSYAVAVISVPCVELFKEQEMKYKLSILELGGLKVAIEAGVRQGWECFIGTDGLFFGVEQFGVSARGCDAYRHFGLEKNNIVANITKHIDT